MDMILANSRKYNYSLDRTGRNSLELRKSGVVDITAENDVSFDVTFTNISYKVKLLQLSFDQDTLDDVKIFTNRVQHSEQGINQQLTEFDDHRTFFRGSDKKSFEPDT